LRPFCRQLLNELVSGVERVGRAEVGRINNSYSVRVICHTLGLPDDDWESVAAWSDAVNQLISVSVVDQLPRIEEAIDEVDAYMVEQIERLRREPRDCLGSKMIAAHDDGDHLSDDELVSLFETLLIAGAESTRNQLSFGLYLFAKHPDQWQALADDPDLAVPATEELLRFRSPFIGTGRIAREDVELHGLTIAAGSYLIMSLPSANHDPTKYPDPGVFDITRFTGGAQPTQLSFGHGAHICIGAPLARVELQEALRMLPERMPRLRLDDEADNPVEWNNPFGVHGPIPLHLRWDLRRDRAR
jgi:cytochrome P450